MLAVGARESGRRRRRLESGVEIGKAHAACAWRAAIAQREAARAIATRPLPLPRRACNRVLRAW